jgi:hypothetical protein
VRIIRLNERNEWIIILEASGQYPTFITLNDFVNRMKKLGWTGALNKIGDNYLLSINTIDGQHYSLSLGVKGWRLTNGYRQTYRELRAQCPDVASFIFYPKLDIPENFDIRTQKKEIAQPQYITKNIPLFNQLPKKLEYNEVLINGQWIKVEGVDWINKTIMDKNGEIFHLPTTNIQIRKQIS